MEKITNYLTSDESLKIVQTPDSFNFCLDSILLANFVKITAKVKNIVDLGCGNAPIPIYLSSKTKAVITGIDIQETSCELAQDSVEINNLEDQIKIINSNIIDIHKTIGHSTYDIVTCNPPYFKYDHSKNVSHSNNKMIARHEVLVNLEQIIKEASKLLKTNGYFYLVHRPERLSEITIKASNYGLKVRRVQFIHPFIDKESNIMLVELRKSDKEDLLKILPPLIVFDEKDVYNIQIKNIMNIKEEL